MDIKHVLSLQPAAPGLPRRAASPGAPQPPAGVGRRRRRRSSRSATTATASPSTTSGPRHRMLRPAVPHRRPARSPAASGWRSSPTAATSGPSCGCPTAGPRCRRSGWEAPLYWERDGDGWSVHTLARHAAGRSPPSRSCHVSLVRGRRLRPLGRRPPADRAGVGARRRRRVAVAARDRSISTRLHPAAPPTTPSGAAPAVR